DVPFDLHGGLSLSTLGFTLLIVLAVTVAAGLIPALISIRGNLSQTLNEGGRGGIGGTRTHRLRGLLVGVEVALAMVALISAGLFLRSFGNASRIEPGLIPGMFPRRSSTYRMRVTRRRSSEAFAADCA